MVELKREQLERYKRHLLLDGVGPEGQSKLLDARVLLIGAGGLGCPSAMYLCAAGVGTLGIVDFDRVDASNLQRQVLFGTSDVGRAKVEVARERLGGQNPDVNVIIHDEKLVAANAERILEEYDVILDGTDTFPSRYLTNDVAVWLGKPLVYGSVMRFEGQVAVFDASRGPCYRCLFPEPPPPELAPNCAEAGVLGVLPGVIGLLQSTEVLKLLLGEGELLIGRLLVYDALAMEFREFKIPKDPDCSVCGKSPTITEPIDYEAFCAAASTEEGTSMIPELTPVSLKARLDAGEDLLLIDVREPFEVELAHIEGAQLIPLGQIEGAFGELEHWKERPVVLHCHSGARSRHACQLLVSKGFSQVENLQGGIDAWSLEVDPSVPRY